MCVLKVKVISLPYIFQFYFSVLCFTRPRYQVSIYRTIGHLVFCFVVAICDLVHDMEIIVHLSYVLTASGNLF